MVRHTQYNFMLYDKVYQWSWLPSGLVLWGAPVSTTNKIDRHNITELLLNVVLNNVAYHKVSSENYMFVY
jgi:hypothetical protein